jgi:hypothetical protein
MGGVAMSVLRAECDSRWSIAGWAYSTRHHRRREEWKTGQVGSALAGSSEPTPDDDQPRHVKGAGISQISLCLVLSPARCRAQPHLGTVKRAGDLMS